jgi:hypothetical protein
VPISVSYTTPHCMGASLDVRDLGVRVLHVGAGGLQRGVAG